MNTAAGENGTGLQAVLAAEVQRPRSVPAKTQSMNLTGIQAMNPVRNLNRAKPERPPHHSPPFPFSTIRKTDHLSGLRSTDLEAHLVGYSPSHFDRCPYQSSPGMVASASTQADDGNQSTVPLEGVGMVGTVAEDIAAGTGAMDIATPGMVAGKAFACSAAARTGRAACRREDTESGNN